MEGAMSEELAKPMVMVADDDPELLGLVSRRVQAMGFRVVEALDGDTAWEIVCRERPILAVLDVMMPGMSGWELCRRIRETAIVADMGVIMLTGIGMRLNEMTSPLYGADDYLDKPFQFQALERKVREVLARRGG